MDPTPLKGKNAIVTGGSRGIGQAIALELATRGATVLITYVSSATGADKTVSSITAAGGKAHAILADSHAAQTSAELIVSEALKFFSDDHIDIIVNNAADGDARPLDEIDTEFFDRLMHANVLLPLLLLKAARGYLRREARVVNVSSTAASGCKCRFASSSWIGRGYVLSLAVPFTYVYGASKAALESVTRSMATELGRSLDGTANAVNPGPVSTDMYVDTRSFKVVLQLMTYQIGGTTPKSTTCPRW